MIRKYEYIERDWVMPSAALCITTCFDRHTTLMVTYIEAMSLIMLHLAFSLRKFSKELVCNCIHSTITKFFL